MAKTVRHARSGEFRRVQNDEAVKLVGSGQWVYSSKHEEKRERTVAAAPRPSARQRSPFLTGLKIAGALLAILIGSMLWVSHARAADKPVPFRVCLTKSQAAQVYKGKALKYRLVRDEHGRDEACWYAGKTLPKFAFIPRSVSTAVRPTLLTTQQEQTRVEEPAGAAPAAGTPFTNALVDDAFKALTGRSEDSFETFEGYWREVVGMAR